MFGNDEKFNTNMRMRMIVLLHITIKNLQQFRVYCMKILTHNYAELIRFHRYDVDDLEKDFVPEYLRIAAQ